MGSNLHRKSWYTKLERMLQLFSLFTIFILCQDSIFDISIASIDVHESENSSSWLVSYNNINESFISLNKDETLIICGETSKNTVYVHGNGNHNSSELNIMLDKFTICDNNSSKNLKFPFYFEDLHSANIFILLNSSITISTQTSAFYISTNCRNCSLSIEGVKSDNAINIFATDSSSDTFIINSFSHIYLRNLQLLSYTLNDHREVKKFASTEHSNIFYGIIGETVLIDDCKLIIESQLISIGGDRCSCVQIISSIVDVHSDGSTCIGSTSSEPLDVEIFNSTINVLSKKDGGSIGNRQVDSGHLSIEKSRITGQSSGSQFSTIGFFKQIDIEDSSVSVYSIRGLCAIGGSAVYSLESEVEINIKNSYVKGYSSGQAASIGCTEQMTASIIIFNSTVSATNSNANGRSGSGIGGSSMSCVRLIEINHSNVTGLSNSDGAPIGSGGNKGHFILICVSNNSNITCENRGHTQCSAAGIGGYCGGSIEIYDSRIEAISGDQGAGIGGSHLSNVDNIIIERSVINSSSKSTGAAIGAAGGGYVLQGIFICDSTVFAFSGIHNGCANGAAIGGGWYTGGGLIDIRRSNITAIAGVFGSAAAIGGGLMGDPGDIFITDSYVYAQSALNGTSKEWSTMAGAGIGSGGTVKEAPGTFPSKGTIHINHSIVIAKGGSVIDSTLKKFPLEAGSAIGYGGTTVYPRDRFYPLNITITNDSIVYAYGGNATGPSMAAAPAISGGGHFKYMQQGTVLIEDSFVHAVSGYNKDNLNRGHSNFGYSWNPLSEPEGTQANDDNMTGEFIVRGNSTVIASHSPDDNITIPVIIESFQVEGKEANIEFHSTNVSSFSVHRLHSKSSYIVTLSNISEYQNSTIKIQKKDELFQKKINVLPNDKAITFSVPSSGVYNVFIMANNVEKEIENFDGRPFKINEGFNVFNNFLIKITQTTSLSYYQTPSRSESPSQSFVITSVISPSKSEIDINNDDIDINEKVIFVICLCVGIPLVIGIIVFVLVVVHDIKKKLDDKNSDIADLKKNLVESKIEIL